MTSISRFTPSTMPSELLERLFVVRQPVLEALMERVDELGTTPSPHHTLLVGPRGAGKTHLISLVYHRSRALAEADRNLQLAWLPEDPWTIVSYRHLLAAILEDIEPGEDLRALGHDELETRLRMSIQQRGPVVVLAENLDQILANLEEIGQQRLRHVLQTDRGVLLIGSTTRLDRNLSDETSPFFGFFDTIRLTPFTPEQARDMLVALARVSEDEVLAERLTEETSLARIHTVTHLAGGQPRLWALLGSALTIDQLHELVDLLLSRFDDLTPYYQEQLARLSPQQRLIVAELAAADRPLPVKDVAERIQGDQRSVAKAVNDLTDRGWLAPTSTIFADLLDRRRTYYELAEPLARLAFQIKESRGEPLRLVVEFLKSWFEPDELLKSQGDQYCQAALIALEHDDVAGLTRRLTSLGDWRVPSLRLLGQVEDAVAAVSTGDVDPVMALPSALRQAIEHRAGPARDLVPIRLTLLDCALKEVGEVPRDTISREWLARAERLDEEAGTPASRLMLVRWLAASWCLDDAQAALTTISSPEDRSSAMNVIARAMLAAGRLNEAIDLYEQTLTDTQRILGPNHPDTLTTRSNLAYAYQDVGRLDEATDLLEQNLTDHQRILGPSHPDTLVARSNLAYAYHDIGRLDEATDLYEQNLTDHQRILGPSHPDTLTTRNNLATAYRSTGRLNEAIDLYEQNLTDHQRILGADHPNTLTTRNNLATAYQDVGRFQEAIDLYEQTLTDRERILGPNHPDTLTTRANLAYTYRTAGRLDEAIDLYEQTLTDTQHLLGPNHPRTLATRHNLATAYQDVGRFQEAARLEEGDLDQAG
ncbi:tetratricopeptide repeat protein [Actinomyces howellii]|uniref:Photosystem I assembly protein Ycf3 n=1 Tax=Actinomyces howellii TaxID=52771 RepID=A0A448HHN4_9ACTO|nr:tetratricopeptide repeat protein [Actinomyces howellii]VEG28712.1 photosystem I assembly protein Ycf3 [Actinomyces howellii]